MNLGEMFHRARSVTPFADQAAYNPNAQLLLQIALQHGYKDIRQFSNAASSELGLSGDRVLAAMQAAANEIEEKGGVVDFGQLLNMYLSQQEGEQKTTDLSAKSGVNFVTDKGIVRKRR